MESCLEQRAGRWRERNPDALDTFVMAASEDQRWRETLLM